MDRYENCCCCLLEDGSYYLEDVCLPQGQVSALYLGSGAIYAVVSSQSDYKGLYQALREELKAVPVFLYVTSEGHYNPREDSLQTPLPQDALLEEIAESISGPPSLFSPDRLTRMRDRLIEFDAYTRGHCRDEKGNLYLLKNGAFRPVSEMNPECCFWLTLFGGCFGLHRMAVGKFFSGMIYLLSCGVFLVGWVLDLLQLFLGLWKDKKGRLILTPKQLGRKLFWTIPGLCLSILFISLYFRLCDVFVLDSSSVLQNELEPLRGLFAGIGAHIL